MIKRYLFYLFIIILVSHLLLTTSHNTEETQNITIENIQQSTSMKSVGITNYMSDDSSELFAQHPSYNIRECKMEIETADIHINIKYPQISSASFLTLDMEKVQHINQMLTPNNIQTFYDMIGDNIIISNTGDLTYDCLPYTYELGMKESYTLGMANDKFLNLYVRSISYSRNSNWSYGVKLINIKSGEQIKVEDFFDIDAFYGYIMRNAFITDKNDFNINLFFENMDKVSLKQYLYHAFINTKGEIEIVIVYGEGPETVIYADIDEVKGMIKPEYQNFLFVK